MKILDTLEGYQIVWVIIILTACITIMVLSEINSNYFIVQTKMFLEAGCEFRYPEGKQNREWVNCKGIKND